MYCLSEDVLLSLVLETNLNTLMGLEAESPDIQRLLSKSYIRDRIAETHNIPPFSSLAVAVARETMERESSMKEYVSRGDKLIQAASEGDLDAVKKYVDLGATNYEDAFIAAVDSDQPEAVKFLSNWVDPDMLTEVLFSSIERDNIEMVRALVKTRTVDINSGLELAAKRGRQEIAGLLLAAGANSYTDSIHAARMEGYDKIAELIELWSESRYSREDPALANVYLEKAVREGNIEKVRMYARKSSNLYFPLIMAAEKGFTDIALIYSRLLEAGANAYEHAVYIAESNGYRQTAQRIREWVEANK